MALQQPSRTYSRRSALNVAEPDWTVTGTDLVLIPSLTMSLLVSVHTKDRHNLQEGISYVTAENIGFQVCVICEFDMETSCQLDLRRQAKHEIDVEDHSNT